MLYVAARHRTVFEFHAGAAGMILITAVPFFNVHALTQINC